MNIRDYLARLGFGSPVSNDFKSLRDLHLAHMLTVPFENLDIGLGRPISLGLEDMWRKIVTNRRGGFCYELNGLFAWLLNEIGFEVTHHNALVFREDGSTGIPFGHLTLLAGIPGRSERWLADVGFGDSFTEPLTFESDVEQIQGLRAYRLERAEAGFVVWRRDYDGAWNRQYSFDLTPRKFPDDFQAGCVYHQTSPLSTFTRGGVISMASPYGRVTLEQNHLIITRNGRREEQPVRDNMDYAALLKQYFGFDPPENLQTQ